MTSREPVPGSSASAAATEPVEGGQASVSAAAPEAPGQRGLSNFTVAGKHIDLEEALRSWLGSALVIVVMVIVFSAMQSRFMTLENWQNIAIQASVLLVIAVAGTFPILIGSIDLSVGSIATLVGIVTADLLADGNFSPVTAVIIGLVVGLLCGAGNGMLLALVRIPSFLVTLGTFFALDGLASYIIRGTPIPITAEGLTNAFDSRWGDLPTIFLWSLAVLIGAALLTRYTRLGRHFYAVGGSEPAAIIAGVNVKFVKIMAFTISGLLAGFAGILLSVHTLSGSPQQAAGLLLPSIGAIVMGGTALSGGVGGPLRTFIGVLLITILINGMQLLSVDPYLQLVVTGGVVILAVIMSRQKLNVFSSVK